MDGAGWDTEMLVAYYCFVNLGWAPSRYDSPPVQGETAGDRVRPEKHERPEGSPRPGESEVRAWPQFEKP